ARRPQRLGPDRGVGVDHAAALLAELADLAQQPLAVDRCDPLVARRRRLAALPAEPVAAGQRRLDRDDPLGSVGGARGEEARVVLEAGGVAEEERHASFVPGAGPRKFTT